MRYYYILGNGQPNDRAVYFTNKESAHGGEYWGNIAEAYLFTSMQELCDRLVRYPELRCFIAQIADVTVERIKAGAAGDPEYTALYHKFNRVSYVMDSECQK